LWQFGAPIAMGAGYATGRYGPSMTELCVGGDRQTGPGQADAPTLVPAASLPGSPGGANVSTVHSMPAVVGVSVHGRAIDLRLRCAGGDTGCRLRVLLETHGSASRSRPGRSCSAPAPPGRCTSP
jgi:hypothetical protein